MKMAFLAAAAMIATPLFAQTTPASTPSTSDPSAITAPAGQSTMATPPADSSMATPPAATAPADSAMAAPAPETGKLPWCHKGQYTACREHENAQGKGLSKS